MPKATKRKPKTTRRRRAPGASRVHLFDGSPREIRRWDQYIGREAEAVAWAMLRKAGAVRDGRLEVAGLPSELILMIARRLGFLAMFSKSFRYLIEKAAVLSGGNAATDFEQWKDEERRKDQRRRKLFRTLGPLLGTWRPRHGRPRKPEAMKGEGALEFFLRLDREAQEKGSLTKALLDEGSETGLDAARRRYRRGRAMAVSQGLYLDK